MLSQDTKITSNQYSSDGIDASETDYGPAGRRMPALGVHNLEQQWYLAHRGNVKIKIYNKDRTMKTLTIKRDMITSLDSDESKLEFTNQVIALLSDPNKISSGKIDEALIEGLNLDIPEPMRGTPDFDSSNMAAAEYKRYSMVRAGYVPAGGRGLNCSYDEYEYKHLSELSEGEFESHWDSAILKLKQDWKKKDYAKFLKYLCDIYGWFYSNKVSSSA